MNFQKIGKPFLPLILLRPAGLTAGGLMYMPGMGMFKPRIRKETTAISLNPPRGEMQLSGIPAMPDRFIKQAIAQIPTSLFNPDFSESSDGFHPER